METMKSEYKHKVENPNFQSKLVDCIRNTGGWKKWVIINLELIKNTSITDAKIIQQEYITKYNPDLNVRNVISQYVYIAKKNEPVKKNEIIKQKFDVYFDKCKENLDKRKSKFIEKNKKNRYSKINQIRELKMKKSPIIIIEDDEEKDAVEKEEIEFKIEEESPQLIIHYKQMNVDNDEKYISVWSNDFMEGILQFQISNTLPKKPLSSFCKCVIAKKISNATYKEKLIYDILSNERINAHVKFFKVNINMVRNIFDLMDGKYSIIQQT